MGFVGIVQGGETQVHRDLVARMCEAIRHRGPDEDGFYFNGAAGLSNPATLSELSKSKWGDKEIMRTSSGRS